MVSTDVLNLSVHVVYIVLIIFSRSGQMYYMFGFIFLAFLILAVTCCETAILLCYFHLCSEVGVAGNNVGMADATVIQDYRWWWRSFFSSGSTALYLFLFTIHYFYYKLSIQGMASSILYFGYTSIMVLLFFVLTGQWVCSVMCVIWSY